MKTKGGFEYSEVYDDHEAVTPSETTRFGESFIYVGVLGDIEAISAKGNAVVYVGYKGWLPGLFIGVGADNTNATDIVRAF